MSIAALIALSLALNPVSAHVQKKPDVLKPATDILDTLPIYVGPKRRIAVQDMEVKVSTTITQDPTPAGGQQTTISQSLTPPTDFGTGLTEMLVTALQKTNRFVLLERSDKGIQDIQKEQTLQGVSEQTRAAANNMLGAEILVRGAVTEFSYSSSGNAAAGVLAGFGIAADSSTATVAIDVRLYDASTGEIYDSQRAEGKVKSHSKQIGFQKGDYQFNNSDFQSSPLGQASREAITRAVYFICRQMDSRPWEGRIADVVTDEGNGTEIYLNVGSRSGIKVGQEFEVFTLGHAIMDPDSPGRVLAVSHGKRIGRVKVSSVDVNISIAAPVDGDGFAALQVLRLPADAAVFMPPKVDPGQAAPQDSTQPAPAAPQDPSTQPAPAAPAPQTTTP